MNNPVTDKLIEDFIYYVNNASIFYSEAFKAASNRGLSEQASINFANMIIANIMFARRQDSSDLALSQAMSMMTPGGSA